MDPDGRRFRRSIRPPFTVVGPVRAGCDGAVGFPNAASAPSGTWAFAPPLPDRFVPSRPKAGRVSPIRGCGLWTGAVLRGALTLSSCDGRLGVCTALGPSRLRVPAACCPRPVRPPAARRRFRDRLWSVATRSPAVRRRPGSVRFPVDRPRTLERPRSGATGDRHRSGPRSGRVQPSDVSSVLAQPV